MTGAFVNRPHGIERVAMRPSVFLRVALGFFAGVAGACVFEAVSAHAGPVDACVAAAVCIALLGLCARRWLRSQPAAIRTHADSLATFGRDGRVRHWQIIGSAQFGGWLLALTLSEGQGKPHTLLIPADSIDTDTFRQLAVSARRAAHAYL
jgi:hypothetical protein